MKYYDHWQDRLSEYIDDDLSPAERTELETHLAACADCRETLAEIRALVELAGQLEDRAPEHDLWTGIRDRIRPDWRVTLSFPRLAAACIGLILLGGTTWILLQDRGGSGDGLSPASAMTVDQTPPHLTGPLLEPQYASESAVGIYDAAVADLEHILAEGRDKLATVTIAVLEESLATIDRAIEEARAAIADDPANLYLTNHLADTMRRKLELLRYTNSLVRAQS
jgi:hypothetical protein